MTTTQKNQQKNFWQDLPRPFFALAPMYDVTDAAFRRMIAKYSIPSPNPFPKGRGTEPHYVTFTEFVSADGLCHAVGREKLMHHLWFDEIERPIVAQVFGATPANFYKAAQLIAELGFDGIDINMGCPEKNIVKQGACSALIQEPRLARDIIQATKEGSAGLPVSVKTRIGFDRNIMDTWIPALLEAHPAALTVHLRTRKEMSDVPAHWDLMEDIVKMRDDLCRGKRFFAPVPIIGNGDATSLTDAREKARVTGCDGVMLGRAVFGNPWLFADVVHAQRGNNDERPGFIPGSSISTQERLQVMVEHTKLFEELFAGIKNFAIMKKHYKAYCNGFPNASTLRAKLMEANNAEEVEEIVKEWLQEKLGVNF